MSTNRFLEINKFTITYRGIALQAQELTADALAEAYQYLSSVKEINPGEAGFGEKFKEAFSALKGVLVSHTDITTEEADSLGGKPLIELVNLLLTANTDPKDQGPEKLMNSGVQYGE